MDIGLVWWLEKQKIVQIQSFSGTQTFHIQSFNHPSFQGSQILFLKDPGYCF